MKDHIGKWHLFNETLNVVVSTKNGIITHAPLLVRMFVDQPLDNLAVWMDRTGITTVKELHQ